MKYLIWTSDAEAWASPLGAAEAGFLQAASASFASLSDEEYRDGPAAFLARGVRTSYVLDGEVVYWCAEFDPGLVVIRFSAAGMAWAAFRSPVPGFGGREATDEEWEAYDEDAPNPQYDLIFTPFDAAIEEDLEEFVPASPEELARFDAAVSKANALNESPLSTDERMANVARLVS